MESRSWYVSCALLLGIDETERNHLLTWQMMRSSEGLSHKRYMEMYTVAYNYCTSSRMSHSTTEGAGGGGIATRSEELFILSVEVGMDADL